MIHAIIKDRPTRLFLILGSIFLANAIIAEVIGVKIFSLEQTFHLKEADIQFFGSEGLSFQLTAGVLLWPVVFVMTDIINEYYGLKGVRFLSFIAAILIGYTFLAFSGAIWLTPASWWPGSASNKSVPDMQLAFSAILGQSNWIIIGSLIAFLIGQLVDVLTFRTIKKVTGEKSIWLRATGSTLVSQLIDSYVVLFVAFYIGQDWSIPRVLAIGTMNYIYKFGMAILMTPIIYWVHAIIERYLGTEKASAMKQAAMEQH